MTKCAQYVFNSLRDFNDFCYVQYPGLRIFLNKCVATARRTGYVETLSCRRRQIPDIGSTNMHRYSFIFMKFAKIRKNSQRHPSMKIESVLISSGHFDWYKEWDKIINNVEEVRKKLRKKYCPKSLKFLSF